VTLSSLPQFAINNEPHINSTVIALADNFSQLFIGDPHSIAF
jgi:hypothetical protein